MRYSQRRTGSAITFLQNFTVFSGMIASTCLAVLFVPAFFVVIQRFENWLGERKQKKAGAQVVAQTGP